MVVTSKLEVCEEVLHFIETRAIPDHADRHVELGKTAVNSQTDLCM